MKIEWIGPVFDPSGYGAASRDYVQALCEYGIDITLSPQYFAKTENITHQTTKDFLSSHTNRFNDAQIVVHHYVPNKITDRCDKNKFNIGYNTWETNKIPDHWVYEINNNLDLLMVPSIFNKNIYRECGVTTPIEVVPHCLNMDSYRNAPSYNEKYQINLTEDRFIFFSVFQWTERKNPIGLIKAYYSAFFNNGNNEVCLVLKTYRSSTDLSEKAKIVQEIKKLKEDMNFNDANKCPPILLLTEFVMDEELITLYKMADCFVLPTRGEGAGIPIMEAMACRLPVITTNYSGHLDFCCEEYKGISYYSRPEDKQLCDLIPCQMTPVAHMNWIPHYDGTQLWAEPDISYLTTAMRYIKYDIYFHSPQKAQKHIRENYCYSAVAEKFINAVQKHWYPK